MKINRFIIICLIIISCSNRGGEKKVKDIAKELASENIFNIQNFPDTVLLDKVYMGKMNYTSELDTINLLEGEERFIFFYITTQDGDFHDIEEIEKVEHEVFKVGENKVINFQFKFKKKGINYFTGIIQDMILLNDTDNDGESRIITHLTEINKEVFVIYK